MKQLCAVEGCDRDARAKGLCSGHWKRWSATGVWPTTPLKVQSGHGPLGGPCQRTDCPKDSRGGLHYCTRHYYRLRRLQDLGLNFETCDALWTAQGCVCAICQDPIDIEHTNTHVDHNHITGEVRGILCNRCNMAIGLLREDPKLFAAAVDYLRSSPPQEAGLSLPPFAPAREISVNGVLGGKH